jgi:hypothetical protein
VITLVRSQRSGAAHQPRSRVVLPGATLGRSLKRRRGRSCRSGQALVEFVLILPILVLLLTGLLDFARAWSAQHALADAAREGARMLVVNEGATFNSTEQAIKTRLRNAGLNVSGTSLTIEFQPGPGEGGDGLPAGRNEPQTVTLEYAFDFWFLGPFLNWVAGEPINLFSSITMRGE